MRRPTFPLILCLVICLLPVLLSAVKYAGDIFYLSPGVSNQAMGNTGVTDGNSLSCGWWNPALLALRQARGAELSHAEQFEGLLQFNNLSAVLGQQNHLSLIVTHIGINDIALTKLQNNEVAISDTNRPVIWKKADNNDLMLYLGAGRHVTSSFSIGVTPKLAYRSLADHNGFGFGADFGFLWNANGHLDLGLVAKDCFSTRIIWENGTQEAVSPSFLTEAGIHTVMFNHSVPVRLNVGLETQTDGREDATFTLGQTSHDLHAGLSVSPVGALKLMTGYDAGELTAGVSLLLKSFEIDYAFRGGSEDELGYSQRISAGYRW